MFLGAYIASDANGTVPSALCNDGETLTGYFCFTFENETNSSRTGVYVEADILIGGDVEYEVSFTDPVPAPGNTEFTACVSVSINYQCGDDLSLQGLWFAWDSSGDNLADATRCNQWPGSKCTGQPGIVDITEPMPPCALSVTCPTDLNLGTFNCTNLTDVPAVINIANSSMTNQAHKCLADELRYNRE